MSKAVPGYLGPYRLLNVVHTGPASQIWQAFDDGRQRFSAVKTLREEYRRKRQYVAYLRWEYKVGSRLDSQRTIRVFEFAVDRGAPYLATEWFAGMTMKHHLRQGVEAIAALVPKIVVQAAEGLAYFNAQGWVHRDIKPENFLVADDGEVKLIDFALARRSKGLLSWLFSPRSPVQGTKSYMSPEQIRRKPLDDRADVYSLACTFYELIAGRPPFTANSVKELLNKHLKSPPPPLEAANRRVTPEFAQLIRWAMAKSPADRPRSSEDFCERIRKTPVFWRTLE
jgi:eukaryotic-like serine/threonine-protein kinase